VRSFRKGFGDCFNGVVLFQEVLLVLFDCGFKAADQLLMTVEPSCAFLVGCLKLLFQMIYDLVIGLVFF
jgi:hypothetical protein